MFQALVQLIRQWQPKTVSADPSPKQPAAFLEPLERSQLPPSIPPAGSSYELLAARAESSLKQRQLRPSLPLVADVSGHIFVSYAREDEEFAKAVADLLKSDGFDVWWDRELRGGQTFPDEIENAIAASAS